MIARPAFAGCFICSLFGDLQQPLHAANVVITSRPRGESGNSGNRRAIKRHVFFVTRTWTGGGANNNWSMAANWTGAAPVTGDDLIFNGTTRQNNPNDVSGLNILSVTLNNGGFTLNIMHGTSLW